MFKWLRDWGFIPPEQKYHIGGWLVSKETYEEFTSHMEKGNMVNAIVSLRQGTGIGLKEARDITQEIKEKMYNNIHS